ncbi:hypothetical protein C8Q76DRAFT_705622 [Earliella scabrosa]|nr:hypothetical protein C8Q76DRAFT_705622 [Earliella scabrosa]
MIVKRTKSSVSSILASGFPICSPLSSYADSLQHRRKGCHQRAPQAPSAHRVHRPRPRQLEDSEGGHRPTPERHIRRVEGEDILTRN